MTMTKHKNTLGPAKAILTFLDEGRNEEAKMSFLHEVTGAQGANGRGLAIAMDVYRMSGHDPKVHQFFQSFGGEARRR